MDFEFPSPGFETTRCALGMRDCTCFHIPYHLLHGQSAGHGFPVLPSTGTGTRYYSYWYRTRGTRLGIDCIFFGFVYLPYLTGYLLKITGCSILNHTSGSTTLNITSQFLIADPIKPSKGDITAPLDLRSIEKQIYIYSVEDGVAVPQIIYVWKWERAEEEAHTKSFSRYGLGYESSFFETSQFDLLDEPFKQFSVSQCDERIQIVAASASY